MNKSWLAPLFMFFLILPGCGGGNTVSDVKPYVKPPVITPRTHEKTERPRYSYTGERFRDPFIALISDAPAQSANPGGIVVPSLGTLALRGIIDDGRQKIAMISGNGAAYFLRDKRLFDTRQRLIPGYTGVIRADSVLLIAPDRTSKEFKLREK